MMSATELSEVSGGQGSHFANVVRSEWTKLRSVRSTHFSLIAAVLMTIVIGALAAIAIVTRWPHLSASNRAAIDPTGTSLGGVFLAQLAIGVLGILAITSEYSTSMIRATFAAVPQRRTVLWAKALVFAAVSFVIGTAASFSAFFVTQAILSDRHIQASIADPRVLRAVVGGGLYLMVLGLFAFGLGALIRHTAGAITTLFGVILVLPILANFLPSPWNTDVSRYLPLLAGSQIFSVTHDPSALSTWWGFVVFCMWAGAAVLGAMILVMRRDA